MPGIMNADQGIANGLAEGLKQGLISYQNMKNIQHQNQMQELMTGVRQNPQTGQLEYTPEKQQQMQTQGLLAQRQADELDPNSDVSQRMGTLRGQIVHNASPKLGADIFSGYSAADQKEGEGLIKPEISGQYGMLKQQLSPLVAVKQGQLDVAKDNQSSQAVDKVVKDDQLKSHGQRIQGATRILEQLGDAKTGKIVDTNQLLNDINTEYVNLLTGSNNAALGKQERTEYTTAAGNLAALVQKIKGSPESINSPEILNQLETQVRSLKGNYQKNFKQREAVLKRTYSHNPDATNQQSQALQELEKQFGAADEPQGLMLGARAQQTQAHPQDEAALAWARANPGPKADAIFKANGVTK